MRPGQVRIAVLVLSLTLVGASMLGVALVGTAPPALAQSGPSTTTGRVATVNADGSIDVVDTVTSSGLIDPILASFLRDSITQANQPGTCASSGGSSVPCRTIALVWQMDSEGVVIDDAAFGALLAQMRESGVPVYVWVGPTGAQLTGQAALIAGAAAGVGMSPGTSIGLGDWTAKTPDSVRAVSIASRRPVPQGLVDAQDAQARGITKGPAPTLGDFAVDIPGFQVREIQKDGQTRREPVTLVRFSSLPLLPSLMHSVASPPVTYLLLTIGMALLLFELFTAGVGVAGGVGAGAFVLACYGLAVLPIRPWAVGLVVLSMAAFAVDVQTGIPRFWTAAGIVLYVIGSLTLFDGVHLSWIALLAGVGGVLLTFLSGMPSMVRTRFATPTIGREWMIGEMGRAVTDIDPDGIVQVRGAKWRAYTNRATPVEQLDRVRVIGIEGLVLEVEPELGGARDYRDRSPKAKAGDPAGAAESEDGDPESSNGQAER